MLDWKSELEIMRVISIWNRYEPEQSGEKIPTLSDRA